jgi:AIPR protein
MNLNELEHFPQFLHSYEAMIRHFDEQLGDLQDTKKGELFEKFTLNIIPYSNLGNDFECPRRVKKEQGHQSRDDGADLIATSFDNKKILCIQASYKIHKADTLDTKITRLLDFSQKLSTKDRLDSEKPQKDFASPIIPGLIIPGEVSPKEFHYAIVTLNNIDGIIKSFENRHREIYNQLKQSDRLHVIHGNELLDILRRAYRKSFTIPTSVTLNLQEGPLCVENSSGKVYIGVIAGTELKKCYDEHGESIFFENIREFLGPKSGKKQEDREGVNRAIEKTISDEPETMLAKNNGVAFRAEKVTVIDEKVLCLEKASIVNGCQTTMSLVKNPKKEAHVLVKVVEINSGNSWDIAKSSNYQNPVDLIQLDLAKYIRHQVVKRAAIHSGFTLEGVNSASVLEMMDSINQESGKYQAIYSLFIGFFSLLPNNTVSNLYTKLRGEILEDFYNDSSREQIFRILAKLDQASNQGVKEIEKIYSSEDLDDSSLIQRFLDLQKDNYRALLTILAACSCLGENIYDPLSNYKRIADFLSEIEHVLDTNLWSFIDYFTWSFQSLVNVTDATKNRNENSKDLSNRVSRVKFENLYDDVRRHASIDAARLKRKNVRTQEPSDKR